MAKKQHTDWDENGSPNTLLEAVKYFADPDVAHGFVADLRWPCGDVLCPRCDGTRHSYLAGRRVWKCLSCKKQFSVKVGTIFEDSPLPLSKWLPAMWQLANCKNGISSYELARAIGVTQKTAWFMLSRIRLAMQAKSFKKIDGHVEVDETFIGGKARNMHADKRARFTGKRGMVGKVAVMGLLDRHGNGHSTMRTFAVEGTKARHLEVQVERNVADGATVYTDALRSYRGLKDIGYIHKVIDHAEQYVDGNVHTNGCENFWSLLKRAIKAHMCRLSRSTFSATSTSRRSDSTTARTLISAASAMSSPACSGGG